MTGGSLLVEPTGFASAPPGAQNTNSAADGPRRPSKWELQATARRLLPDERVSACHRVISDHARGVTVRRDGEKAWFAGLAACGSVWHCPVCARKVGERRRGELQAAIDAAIGKGGDVALITFTFSHQLHHRLDDILPKLSSALRRVKSGRQWQRIKQRYNIMGSVRGLEVTHGGNGWHPHVHELEFFGRPLSAADRQDLQSEVFNLWEEACRKEGLGLPTEQHGVDVRGASRAAQYVGKWGFAGELARPATKTGWSGRTSWQLLEDAHRGDSAAAELWQEFALAFKGRRQLFWSRGLRELLELGDLFSDEELAELEPEPDGDVVDVINIGAELWAQICRAERRGELLQLAMTANCKEEIEGWLARLRDKVPIRLWCDDVAVNAKSQKLFGSPVSPLERAAWAEFNQQCTR